MTREQDSDSTLPSEREEREIKTPSPHRPGERRDVLSPQGGENISKLTSPSPELICSFCGVVTHDYKNYPVLHQYIREQADALAQRRFGGYQQIPGWVRLESPKQVPIKQEPLW